MCPFAEDPIAGGVLLVFVETSATSTHSKFGHCASFIDELSSPLQSPLRQSLIVNHRNLTVKTPREIPAAPRRMWANRDNSYCIPLLCASQLGRLAGLSPSGLRLR